MPLETIAIPRVKVIRNDVLGALIVLECLCGDPVPYPGVGDVPNPIACRSCGQHFGAVVPETLRGQVIAEQ